MSLFIFNPTLIVAMSLFIESDVNSFCENLDLRPNYRSIIFISLPRLVSREVVLFSFSSLRLF